MSGLPCALAYALTCVCQRSYVANVINWVLSLACVFKFYETSTLGGHILHGWIQEFERRDANFCDWGGFVAISQLLCDHGGWVVGGGYMEAQRMRHNSVTRKCFTSLFSVMCPLKPRLYV